MAKALSIALPEEREPWWVLDLSRPISVSIGRSAEADLTVPESVSDEIRHSVSRVHARLFQHGDEIWIEDLDSHNFTSVNGHFVFDAVRVPVPCNIRLGALTLRAEFCEASPDVLRRLRNINHDDPAATPNDVLASTLYSAREWEAVRQHFRWLGTLFNVLEAAAQARRPQELAESLERYLVRFLHAHDVRVEFDVPWPSLQAALSPELNSTETLLAAGIDVVQRRCAEHCIHLSSSDCRHTNWIVATPPLNSATLTVVRATRSILVAEGAALGEADALVSMALRVLQPMMITLQEVESRRAATTELLPHRPSARMLDVCQEEGFWGISERHYKALYYSELAATRYLSARRAGNKLGVVFFLGETGTGKSVLSRIIHRLSERGNQPFYELNCAAIPVTLAESELFGYEKGAHDKAFASKRGWFEVASTGTLFLDEIGKTSTDFQSKLLKVLDTGEFCRLGSDTTRKTNCNIILATSEDPKGLCAEGRLLYEFWYRVGAFTITLAPLRDREEDVPHLIEQRIMQLNQLHREEGSKQVSASVLNLLKAYTWPGNIRELMQCLDVAYALSPAGAEAIGVEDLSEGFFRGLGINAVTVAPTHHRPAATKAWDEYMLELEREYFVTMLAACAGNLSEVARRACKPYQTIHNKLHKLRKWLHEPKDAQSERELERLRSIAGEQWELLTRV
ncbi:MAG: sigma 54-interacting transcriptional regulator [Candidatus Hydrogenedentes bacterium]|nr:sigma 54-interacting transcriptional regulator [Candidatus Hydrogenedentota bacterium]